MFVLTLALPASAAEVDVRLLVVQPADVPKGFVVDPDETEVRTNAIEAREFPESRKLFTRWKRVTGYQAMYRRSSARIEARADVFRGPRGADELLALVHAHALRAGISGQRIVPFRIGVEGWIFRAGPSYTLVAWRQGRVFSGVFAEGIPRARTIELARAQQRHVLASLR